MTQRTFRDRFGREWQAWEVNPAMAERRAARERAAVLPERRRRHQPRAALPEDLRNGWLAFQSRAERRRIAPTPEGWDQLSDAQLEELLERARMTAPSRRLIE